MAESRNGRYGGGRVGVVGLVEVDGRNLRRMYLGKVGFVGEDEGFTDRDMLTIGRNGGELLYVARRMYCIRAYNIRVS